MPDGTAERRGRKAAQDVDRHVAGKIRELRITLGLTQDQVAELIGVTYQQMHKYERSINRLSAGQLHAIACVLGVEPGYLFEGLTAERPAGPTERQRALLDLTRNFAHLPSRRHQEALCELARALSES